MERRVSLRTNRPRTRHYSPGIHSTSAIASPANTIKCSHGIMSSAALASEQLASVSNAFHSCHRYTEPEREKRRIPGSEKIPKVESESATNVEVVETIVDYPAEILISMTNRHPLLLYRFRSDPTLCYKFFYRNTRCGYHTYMCLACHAVRHNSKIRRGQKNLAGAAAAELPVLAVSMDYSHFLVDPESLAHFCLEISGVLKYTLVMAQQEYREVSRLVEFENIDGAEADRMLKERIRLKFPTDADAILNELGTSKQRRATFCRRQKKHPECVPKARHRINHTVVKEAENLFPAEVGLSKSKSHPLLIYRLRAYPEFCFKFHFKRQNQTEFAYLCLGCRMAKTTDPSLTLNIPNIAVSANFSHFLSDPEGLQHCCIESGFLYQYAAVHLEQLYRDIRARKATESLTYQQTLNELAKTAHGRFPGITAADVAQIIPEKSFSAIRAKRKIRTESVKSKRERNPQGFEYFEGGDIDVQREEEIEVEETADEEINPKRQIISRSPQPSVMVVPNITADDEFIDVVTVDGRSIPTRRTFCVRTMNQNPIRAKNSWELGPHYVQNADGEYLEEHEYSIIAVDQNGAECSNVQISTPSSSVAIVVQPGDASSSNSYIEEYIQYET